jgi:hypothetical protein
MRFVAGTHAIEGPTSGSKTEIVVTKIVDPCAAGGIDSDRRGEIVKLRNV